MNNCKKILHMAYSIDSSSVYNHSGMYSVHGGFCAYAL